MDKSESWSPPAGGEASAVGEEQSSPSLFKRSDLSNKGIKEISVFVDESGSFDPDAKSSQFYLVSNVETARKAHRFLSNGVISP